MKKIGIAAACILILPVVALTVFFQTRLPEISGARDINSVMAPVQVYRDAHGIPHIFAENLNDGYAALGYLHASDRLFQMEMMRRAGTGRLAEILGKDLINYDKKMRALGFYAATEPYYKGLSVDAQKAMQAYANGVNDYMKEKKLPAEFALLGFKPEPWQAWDGLIWAKMMAWQLSGNLDDEIFRATLLKKGWTREQVLELYPVMDRNVPSTLKPMEWIRSDERRVMSDEENNISIPVSLSISLTTHHSTLNSHFEHLPHTASNAYVIAGAHTQSQKPILANDPHLQLQSPILWYLARIVTPQGELKGATAPGMPFFPLGQNGNVAWGFTTSNMDAQDITFVDAQTKFTTRSEVVHVKDGADVTFDVEENENGVVVSGIIADISAITPQGKKAVLQFTGFDKRDRTAQALYEINLAHNVGEIENALKDYSAPPQNFVYADNAGHIGYRAVGNVPKRVNSGLFAAENQVWSGMLGAMPQLQDPQAGVIMTANNAVVDDGACAAFTCTNARNWSEPYRAMQLETWFNQKISGNTKFDVQQASGAMLENISAAATHFLPVMFKILGSNKNQEEILAALQAWDGAMLRDKPEPLIYHAWLDALMQRRFGDTYRDETLWPRMRTLEKMGASITHETLHLALSDALKELESKYGANWREWRWGDAHTVAFKHPLWSHVPVINQLTSLKTEMDGDGHTLRRAAPGNYNAPYEVEHGAGYRGVYDLADPSKSRFVIATGQSAHIFSAHYGDLRDVWNAGEFVTLTGDEKTLQAQGAAHLTLNAIY